MSDRMQDLLQGFGERIQRLSIFAPLFELSTKRKTDREGNSIDWFSLGVLGLLFFFESMLTRNRDTSIDDLGEFLYQQNADGPIREDREGFIKLAREIVEAFRDPTGQRKSFTVYDWETRKEETYYFTLLDVRDYNLKENRQYYQLTDRGLELVFATKEYFSEYQISINQLVLRKQLEKGEFNSALREIDEMRVAVEELRKKLIQLGHEVQRNIVSSETQDRYSRLVDDITYRLEREQAEFADLEEFVRTARQKFEYDQQGEKEQRSYRLIVKIANELHQVHHLHRTLLDESITLKRKVLHAAKESLYHVGRASLNFDQDLVSRTVASPLPPKAVHSLVRPMALLDRYAGWSPLTLFAPQRMEKHEEPDEARGEFATAISEEERPPFVKLQRENFMKIAEVVDQFLHGKKETRLSEFVEWLRDQPQGVAMLEHRSFYEFWLLLHQRSPLFPGSDPEEAGLLDGVVDRIGRGETLVVKEVDQLLRPHERFTIQEMILRRGEESNDDESDVSSR
ncbi:replicative DNA helicase [Tumebacillus sp. DT12]|uniref:Replicative DNA helicase n=1 Tax=Tumebacillus lacus TaxID=2995335 RepID=A0ABT3WY74_9BACL|nr:replicative DNA helicase [Tumebacillus lacus]MCX7568707.1 replicative DNA helicase [Tumebacillus lacus]